MHGKVSAQIADARYARGRLRCSASREKGGGAGNEREFADKLAA